MTVIKESSFALTKFKSLFLFRCFVIGGFLTLGGCQTTSSYHQQELIPIETLTSPPVISTPHRENVSAHSLQQSQAIITVHLAQLEVEPELLPVQVEQKMLYAIPKPIFIQSDMTRVFPITTADLRSFLLVELHTASRQRLQLLRRQAQGHFLLLSVNGELVSVNKIESEGSESSLMMAMSSPEHAKQVLRLMQTEPE